MSYFDPQFAQPDDLIRVDGQYYGVFNVQGEDYDFPILVFINDESMLLDTTTSFDGSKDDWENTNNRIFVELMDYSSIIDDDDDWVNIESSLERQLERQASLVGDWIFDEEIVSLYAYARLTGNEVTEEDLKLTKLWDNSTKEERDWMGLYARSPEKAQDLLNKNKGNFNLVLTSSGISGSGRDALASQLNKDVTTKGMGHDEAKQIMKYLSDPYLLSAAGGKDLIPEQYHKYLEEGVIDATKAGELQAVSLIKEYVGESSLKAFQESGLVSKYAGMLRMDGMSGSSTMKDTIVSELQTAHDTLFPHFNGSKHSVWSPSFYQYASNTVGKALSTSEKTNVENMARDFKGDFNSIGKQLRKDYINTDFVRNQMIDGMSTKFSQDLSAVY